MRWVNKIAFDTPSVFLALVIVIGVPVVILIALDRLGMFSIFGSKPPRKIEDEQRKLKAQQTEP
ncbi:MAG: hypothetical protein JRN52_01405 [Nitrososphaerota archaeon]|nr:hypothetical protein [Nitrososphaerota archaeon]